MPLDPGKIQGRLLTCGGFITVGAAFAGAIACFPASATSAIATALGVSPSAIGPFLNAAASVLPGVAGSLLASDCFEFAKRFRPSADVLRNHDLSKAVGMAIAIVICNVAKDKDNWTKTRLEELANKAVKFWPDSNIKTDSKYIGIREEYLTALFDKSAADFTKVKALDRWEDWLDILNWLCAEETPKIDYIPEEVLGEIAKALHNNFPQALREVLKQNPVAFAGMMLLLMGEFITEIRESKAELASKCDLILAEVQEIKSRNSKILLANSENLTPQPPSLQGKGEPESPSPCRGGVGEGSAPAASSPTVSFNAGESFKLPQPLLDSFQSWMKQVESGLRDELRAIAHNLVTIDLSDPYPNISDFIGRNEEINKLHNLLSEGKKQLIGITGVGGMGKSTLAAKIYQETELIEATGFKGKFWVDILRNPEMRLFTGMARLVLRQFLHLPEDSPILKDELNLPKRLLTCLQNNKYLLVIDNLETLLQDGQFRDSFYQQFFQDWLGYGGKSVILVTTQERWDLPSDNRVELVGFKPEVGLMLLKALGITGTEEGLQAFSQRVKGHPLALKLVAGFLKEEEGENADISFLDKNPLQILGWHRGETVSVEEVLAASFNRLDERLKKLLLNVSVYRLRFNSLAAAAVMGEENVEKDLRLLVRKSLLQEKRENRQWWFQFQPLVLEYVRGIGGDLKEAHERTIDYYISIAKQSWYKIDDIAEYLEIFYHHCQLKQYAQANYILNGCDNFLRLGGYQSFLAELYQKLVQEWQPTVNQEDKNALGWAMTCLGNGYDFLGKFQQAIEYHQHAVEIFREIQDSNGEASALTHLSQVYNDDLGQPKQAIDMLEQSLEIFRAIQERHNEAVTLDSMGLAYRSLEQYEQAIQHHQQALEIYREIDDLGGKASSLNNLGGTYGRAKQYQKAIEYCQQSLQIQQEIGNIPGKADAVGSLGWIYSELGQYQQAIDLLQQARKIYHDIGKKNDEIKSLHNLADAYDSLGEYQQAINCYQQSLKITQTMEEKEAEVMSWEKLGEIYYFHCEYEQSIECYQQMLAILKITKNFQSQAAALGNIGNAYRSLNEYQQSVEFYQQALVIFEKISDLQGQAYSLGNLGITYTDLGQYREAIDYYEQARLKFQQIGARQDEATCLQTLSKLYHQTGRIKEGFASAQTASEILMEIGKFPDDLHFPQSIKSVIKFAQRGKWQLALCFILGLFAFPFALVWIVSLMLWQLVRAQIRRRG